MFGIGSTSFTSKTRGIVARMVHLISPGTPVFTAGGQILSPQDLASEYLGLLAWRAEELATFANGSGFGFSYAAAKVGAGFEANLDFSGESQGEILAFFLEAIADAKECAPKDTNVPGAVNLDGLVASFKRAMAEKIGLTGALGVPRTGPGAQ